MNKFIVRLCCEDCVKRTLLDPSGVVQCVAVEATGRTLRRSIIAATVSTIGAATSAATSASRPSKFTDAIDASQQQNNSRRCVFSSKSSDTDIPKKKTYDETNPRKSPSDLRRTPAVLRIQQFTAESPGVDIEREGKVAHLASNAI